MEIAIGIGVALVALAILVVAGAFGMILWFGCNMRK